MILGSALQARKSKSGWAEYMRAYRIARPDVMKKIVLKKDYGISLEQYTDLWNKQKGLCAICKLPETTEDHRTKTVRKLAVDHCHVTKKVRGLLCTPCNRALGMLKDDPKLVARALRYLRA